ncbi:MAG TPA: extracellular solute-binding protein [Clostridiaceae bacterium]|nr:extracellular solute-binding protein [Clostridiaceae bacterium]
MKMLSKFKLSLILVAMILLAACGGASDKTSGTTKGTTSETTQVTDQGKSEDKGAFPIEKGAKLVYWSMWSETEPQAIVIAEAADAFESKYGVSIEVNFNGRQLQRDGLQPALDAGQEIDLFDEDIDRVSGTWAKYLLPLDDYVNGVYEDTNGQPYVNLVNKTLMDLSKTLGGGSYTTIPYQPFIYTTHYNKKLFEAAGITTAPKTWDEFLDVCSKLKASGVIPFTVDNAYYYGLFGYVLDRIVGYEKCAEMVANVDFSDPGVLKACEVLEDMVVKGYISPKAATNVYPEGQSSEFATEQVAMYLTGTWLPNEIKPLNPNIQWGSFAWPAIDPAGDGIEANNYGSQSFGINKNSKYPNAAFAFIRFLTLGEYDQKLATESLGVPMANNATWPAELADAKALFDSTTKRLPWAVGMEDPAVGPTIAEGFQKLVTGTFNAKQYAESLAAMKK